MTDNSHILKGLTDIEVQFSREKHGWNVLTPPKRKPIWKLYLEKFEDPVIRILLVAACLSLVISVFENEYAETIGIIAAILLATGVGFAFEYDANRKFDLLNTVNDDNAVRVIRNGHVSEIPRKEVVVGDVVLLETGEEVPADGKLLEATSLLVNESSLTGEPSASKTTNEAHFHKDATYADNMVMRGTTVLDGHGVMEVLFIGDATEIGKVARQSTEETHEETPLNQQLEKLANLIGYVGFTVAGLAFLVFFIKDVILAYDFVNLHTFEDWLDPIKDTLQIFMMAVTLIVVAVPEGLPMSVTLSLALNMRRMLSTNNLVRKMHACETMGAINVICTDKTGTLTQNQMQVQEACFFGLRGERKLKDDEISALVKEGISVNSTSFLEIPDDGSKPTGIGNPTEAALLLWLHAQGIDYLRLRQDAKLLDQLAFSTERKYMTTLVHSALLGKDVLYIKGAPEIVAKMCSQVATTKGLEPIGNYKQTIEQDLLAFQSQGMRTLGFAYKMANDTIFLGYVAISDPVRPDVPNAVKQCQLAGIQVKIVTGDTPATAKEIGRQIGLWTKDDNEINCITGTDFASLSDKEALDRVLDLKIMSRARPTDKQRLVQLLQQKGAVVAVTGDGTNDAPALHHAQVGLSMGSGTSVAKEASDITLLDDSFKSIGTAVMWGRSLYRNIQRFISFQLTINLVALLIVLLGAFVGTELPLTVTQMLWVNLIMDTFAALALASIPPSESVMHEMPRKPTDFIISSPMKTFIFGYGMIFLFVLMGLLYYFNQAEGGMTLHRLTIFFTVFVMLQFWNLFNAKAFGSYESAFNNLSHSFGLMGVAILILIGQILIVEVGGSIFRTEPLSMIEWIAIVGFTSCVLWIGEIERFFRRVKHG
ncbi:MAG: calcium-translocating P-type ATPase, PMCA-type [Bacteroidaceae bacterium]|nr:calcium-translocating P-type ATPase, PMCA-type [Bacteroidaceae bacterium]